MLLLYKPAFDFHYQFDQHGIFVDLLRLIGTQFPEMVMLHLSLCVWDPQIFVFFEQEIEPLYSLTNVQCLWIELDTADALSRNISGLKDVCNMYHRYPVTKVSREFSQFLKKENRQVEIFGSKLIEMHQDLTVC